MAVVAGTPEMVGEMAEADAPPEGARLIGKVVFAVTVCAVALVEEPDSPPHPTNDPMTEPKKITQTERIALIITHHPVAAA